MPFLTEMNRLNSEVFDYIIVGGGSAGCVLASRLTENSSCSVLLIESGDESRHPLIRVPTGVGVVWKKKLFDWKLKSTKAPSLNNREIELMRGKLLGGSSAINAMSHVRGAPADYDGWQNAGCDGWSYADVAPYFKKTESWNGKKNTLRGVDGPLAVSPAASSDLLFDAWMAAAKSSGHATIDDYNALAEGRLLEGFAPSQQTIDTGFRATSWSAYLAKNIHRPNLHVLKNTHVTKIRFDKNRAQGLEIALGVNRRKLLINIDGAIILSAGAFHTPHLLMHSGVGPEGVLKSAGVPLVLKAENIGRNYRDHLAVQINFGRRTKGPFHKEMRLDRVALNFPLAALFGKGPMTQLPGGMHGFVRLDKSKDAPDLQFLFRGAPKYAAPWWPIFSKGYEDGFGIRPVLLHPKSHGHIEVINADPFEAPKIDGQYLSKNEDIEKLLDGINIAMEMADDPAMRNFKDNKANSVPLDRIGRINWIRQTAVTAHHPCGTCQMGSDEAAPVTSELRLKGFDNVFVVDASVFPRTISGNINACVYMVAEKASDFLKGLHDSDQKN